jgi:hypothetical protein
MVRSAWQDSSIAPSAFHFQLEVNAFWLGEVPLNEIETIATLECYLIEMKRASHTTKIHDPVSVTARIGAVLRQQLDSSIGTSLPPELDHLLARLKESAGDRKLGEEFRQSRRTLS